MGNRAGTGEGESFAPSPSPVPARLVLLADFFSPSQEPGSRRETKSTSRETGLRLTWREFE